jgi:hypothetical protein
MTTGQFDDCRHERRRAGGDEELGGLRALDFHHRCMAIQASTTTRAALA